MKHSMSLYLKLQSIHWCGKRVAEIPPLVQYAQVLCTAAYPTISDIKWQDRLLTSQLWFADISSLGRYTYL